MSNIELKNAGLKITLPRVKILSKLESSENHHMSAEVHDFNTNLNSAIKSIALYVDTDVGAEDIRFFNIIALKDSAGSFNLQNNDKTTMKKSQQPKQ